MKISKAITESMSQPTAPSERLYPDLSSVSERLINEKIQANNKFNNNINIKKDRNYYETETNNYNKKLSRYKNYINIAEITEIVLSSIATTTSVALTGIGLPYSIPTAFATATVCGSLSKTIKTKIRNKIIKYSQMFILSK